MSARKVVRRRESFDEVAELYDRARPSYPPLLIDEIVDLTSLKRGSRVLEIGCGSGQLTVPLAEHEVTLIAVELGSNLAEITRRKLSRFERAQVVVADFDRWAIPGASFDVVVSATAFHWLDPATRLRRCADALRPGGRLAIIGTEWGVGGVNDAFFKASQSCYARWDPDYEPESPRVAPGRLPVEPDDLTGSQLFATITHRRFVCERTYSATQYCDLLDSFSNVRAWEGTIRAGFLACIGQLIQTQFEGRIVQRDLYDLWLARIRD